MLTARDAYIGREHRNRPWENAALGAFLLMALLGAYGVVQSLGRALGLWS